MTKGKRIEKARKAADLTLEELAIKIGTTRQTVWKYENDIITNIPSDKIEMICDAVSVTPDYIMGWKPITEATPEEQAEFDAMITNDVELMRRIKKYLSLNEAGKKAVDQLIDTLADNGFTETM